MTDPITIGGTAVFPGERANIDIPVARRYTQASVTLPVKVVRGAKPGPVLLVSAAIHGDELNGIEIIARVLKRKALDRIRGTLIAVPVVNVLGFLQHNRYLPDRRDLNRFFPGSSKGSLTARLAHTFMEELVGKATHVVDLHTGSNHRANLPQIRACLDDAETTRLAHAFGAPIIIDANLKDGSLRQAVLERGIPMLLYESGEALRFDELGIQGGVRGIISVMRAIDMLPKAKEEHPRTVAPLIAHSTRRLRAPESGIFHTSTRLGARVDRGQLFAHISDPLREKELEITTPYSGIVIGRTNLPLVNEGDTMFHIATFQRLSEAAESVEAFADQLQASDFGPWG
ncbi:MAG: succinylglutamate desuccinylase/aspartoacylase family protein [Myxococcales bacterium]|nr:succinylglutamate desuccinylase/aspartoacylase family protein [Myxococcales bacterium]